MYRGHLTVGAYFIIFATVLPLMAHPVLTSPELVRVILELSEKDSHVSALTVCKFWSEISLDILWREVEGFGRLATALGTLVGRLDPTSSRHSFVRLLVIS